MFWPVAFGFGLTQMTNDVLMPASITDGRTLYTPSPLVSYGSLNPASIGPNDNLSFLYGEQSSLDHTSGSVIRTRSILCLTIMAGVQNVKN